MSLSNGESIIKIDTVVPKIILFRIYYIVKIQTHKMHAPLLYVRDTYSIDRYLALNKLSTYTEFSSLLLFLTVRIQFS